VLSEAFFEAGGAARRLICSEKKIRWKGISDENIAVLTRRMQTIPGVVFAVFCLSDLAVMFNCDGSKSQRHLLLARVFECGIAVEPLTQSQYWVGVLNERSVHMDT
jgi:hypothetical protein